MQHGCLSLDLCNAPLCDTQQNLLQAEWENVTFVMQCQLNDEMAVWLEPSLLKWSALPSQCYLDVLAFHQLVVEAAHVNDLDTVCL